MPATKKTLDPVAKVRKASAASRRTYHSPLRYQQSVNTHRRILVAGAQIARESPTWDWEAMTFRAIGERAGMSERTVRRHFATERAMRDAVQQHLFQECGIDFNRVEITTFADAAGQVYRYLAGFASVQQPVTDPGLAALDAERRGSLLRAVARATPGWSPSEHTIAAAVLDLLWTPANLERFNSAWQLDQAGISRLIQWTAGLLHVAMQQGRRP
jgi:AcrR family transcriptional regulator